MGDVGWRELGASAHAGSGIDGWYGAARHVSACWQRKRWSVWRGRARWRLD